MHEDVLCLVNSGPWKHAQKFKAESIGSEEMYDPSETQDIKGFYETARVSRHLLAIIHIIILGE